MEEQTEQSDTAGSEFTSALESAESAYDGSLSAASAGVAEKSAAVAEAAAEVEPAKGKETANTGAKSVRERKRENNSNAQRRINESHQRLRSKIESLEAEIEKLKKDGSPASYLEQRNLERQRDTYQEIVGSADADEFENRASEVFGESTPEFMEDTYKWSSHVNANEPELQTYISRPYGLVLLREWYKRMSDTDTRNEWLNMTAFEKGKVLDGFYGQMLEIARKIGQEQQAGAKKPVAVNMPNIPAVSGGRDANVAEATDDFGIALQSAYSKFGVKR